MASNMEAHKAIERSRCIKIYSFVNDHGGMYETFTCKICNEENQDTDIYIHVDHLMNRITLGIWRYTNLQHVDILAILNGDTKTLDQMDIQSSDETKLGRLHQNTVVSDLSNSAILEYISPHGETIIRDPRTNAFLAKLYSSKFSDPTKLTTIVYEPEVGLNTITKTLILLLAFKIFKTTARPALTIHSWHYSDIDDLTNIQNISISKSSYKREGKMRWNYFAAFDMHTYQTLLAFEVFGDGTGNCNLSVCNHKGQTLFTAAPLTNFKDETTVFVNKTTKIGYTWSYTLRTTGPTEYKAELISDGQKLPNEPNLCFKICRRLTNQQVATITPDSSTFPRQVIMDIHPAVDNVHKALLLTYAIRLIVHRYLFHMDEVTTPVAPTRFKETASFIAESLAYSSNTAVVPINSQTPVNIGTSINIGTSYSGQSNEAHTFHSGNQPLATAYNLWQPPYTAQPPQRQPNIQQPDCTQDPWARKKNQGYQPLYPGQQTDGGRRDQDHHSLYTGEETYAGQRDQGAQPPYTGEGTYVDQRCQGHQSTTTGELSYTDQRYQLRQSAYAGLWGYTSHSYPGHQSRNTGLETDSGQTYQGYQLANAGQEAYADQNNSYNQEKSDYQPQK